MTQSEFAREAGVSQGSLSDIESCKATPSIDTIISIVQKNSGLSLDWLLLERDRDPASTRPVRSAAGRTYSPAEEALHEKVDVILHGRDGEARSALVALVEVLVKVIGEGTKKRGPR